MTCPCGYNNECPVWCGNGHQTGQCPKEEPHVLYEISVTEYKTLFRRRPRFQWILWQRQSEHSSIRNEFGRSTAKTYEKAKSDAEKQLYWQKTRDAKKAAMINETYRP